MSNELKSKLLETEIARQMPDLVGNTAVDYIRSLVKSWYEIDDSGEFKPTESAPVGRDAKPIPVEMLGDLLRMSHSYLFRPKQPASEPAKSRYKPRNEMSLAEKSQAMRELSEAEYLALPLSAAETVPPEAKRRRDLSVPEKAYLMKKNGGFLPRYTMVSNTVKQRENCA